ncbi:MAG: acyl transferase [Ferruginibacter sp.]
MQSDPTEIEKKIFKATNVDFEALAIDLFNYQYQENSFYRSFCNHLKIRQSEVQKLTQIPFLPIRFFKTNRIVSGVFKEAEVFESSGTSGSINSKHFVKDLSLYETSFLKGISHFYGDLTNICIIGLLPSYLEKGQSSLVYMVNNLIQKSKIVSSGFFLNETEALKKLLLYNESIGQQTLLFGVTYALLDFAEENPLQLQHTTVVETGGMKGRRTEMTRSQVHDVLKKQWQLKTVHSEYGMTELLSQAYSFGEGLFRTSPWMKVLIRAEDDPFEVKCAPEVAHEPITGVINIIDLANIYSCAFIATDDMGILYQNESFEVVGRIDNSDIRGCSLMLL